MLLIAQSSAQVEALKTKLGPTELRCVTAVVGGDGPDVGGCVALVLDSDPDSAALEPLLEQARARQLPIVLITSDVSDATVNRLCEGGPIDFVPRSVPAAALRAKIELYAELASKKRLDLKGEQVLSRRSFLQAETVLRNLVDNLPELAWSAQPDGHIDFYNRRWYEYTGTTFEQMSGWGWKAVHDSTMVDEVTRRWQWSLDTGEPFEMEFPLRGADGEFRWFLTRVRPLRDGSGKIVRWFGINTNIHERKALIRQLQAASHEKDEFLATVSHELRTPLTAILGWARILTQGADSARLRQGLEVIERNARAQARLIDDLLDVSRIISGRVRMNLKPVSVIAVILAAVEAVRPSVTAKNLRLTFTLDEGMGEIVADEDRLQQVIWNLLSNAVKFTPNGGDVTLQASRAENEVSVTVRDSGAGISPAFLPHVFDRFSQDDRSTTRTHAGLGLGLAIVRHLVELHGGTVRALSEGHGRGATFEVRLPLRAIERPDAIAPRWPLDESPAQKTSAVRLSGVDVLVVDDQRDARELVAAVLEDAGARVAQANSARAARELLASQRIAAVVSDIGMPDEDGYSFLQSLRRADASAPTSKVPALALTAFARAEDRDKALAAGFDEHLSKPIDPAKLVEVVAGLVNR